MRKTSIKFLEYETEIYQRLSESQISFLKKLKKENINEFTIKELMEKTGLKKPYIILNAGNLYTSLILDKEEEIILSEKNNRKYFVDKYKINLFTKKIFEVLN